MSLHRLSKSGEGSRMPKISVIMPVYMAEKYVEDAVWSILNQNYSDFELIIIDDKGTDNSISIIEGIKDSRIKILENNFNRGIAFSRNKGIENATGEYIALMDDDDIAPLNRLKIENEFLDSNLDITAVGGAMHIINQDNAVTRYNYCEMIHDPERLRAELLFRDVVMNGSTMFRRELVLNHDIKYQDNMNGMEDYRFWIDCSVFGKIVNLDHVLLYWRDSLENETTKNKSLLRTERQETYKKIQEHALKVNGFYLSEDELKCFQKGFAEGGKTFLNKEDLEQLYWVLRKIMRQGKEKPFSKQLELVCKRMFGRRVENSYAWDI